MAPICKKLTKEHTKSLCTLGPGIKVPLELHLAMWLHRVHNHLEGPMQLEVDLQMGQCMNTQQTQLQGAGWHLPGTHHLSAHQHTPASWRAARPCCCHSPEPRRQSAGCVPGASGSWSWSSVVAPGAPAALQSPSAGREEKQ